MFKSTFDLPIRFRHYATRLDGYELIFGGFSMPDSSALHSWREICLCNTFSEKITVCHVERDPGNIPIATCCGCAVSIGSDIYTFGGEVIVPGQVSFMCKNSKFQSAVWKLSHKKTKVKYYEEPTYTFEWSEMKIGKEPMPAPRAYFSAWEYEGCVWIFGGILRSTDFVKYADLLNSGHGKISNVKNVAEMDGLVLSNQLFRYDPSSGRWENVEYNGEEPCPRADTSATSFDYSVLLYGGLAYDGCLKNDLYHLDMRTRHWSRIETGEPVPKLLSFHTLNHVKGNAILYGGFQNDEPWIFNISNKKWKKLDMKQYRGRIAHTATSLENAVVIIGGYDECDPTVTNVLKLTLCGE